jgi:leader peptidase (prepilin peptidase)/N-methyltransferase
MLNAIFDSNNWASVPFHFWSFVFFCFGSVVGSFLNVCIYRMPLDQSVVSPPSHCPHCKYSIPWFLNIPLVTWVYLGGKCKNCGALISARYFFVELLTAICFISCWIVFGRQSAALALVYCLFLAGLIVATFIDFEHYIIPDEITIGGMLAGFLLSFLVPRLHEATSLLPAMKESLIGMAAGAGIIYLILRLGKLMFGRQKLELPEQARIIFGETALKLPDKEIPYEDLFYRNSDAISFQASRLEMADRCYKDVAVKLKMTTLMIGEETLNPAEVPYLEAMASQIVLPREAMGFGDVKFMGAIGAFLGWKAVVFTLMASSVLGSIIGVGSLVLKKEGGSRLPYGPYIAMAAAIWVFGGKRLIAWWLGQ